MDDEKAGIGLTADLSSTGMDVEAAANTAASSSIHNLRRGELSTPGVIGRSASYPLLQVMSPKGPGQAPNPGLASLEAMAHHGADNFENEKLQRRKGRTSRSPRRSADSSVQVREVSVRTTMTTTRSGIPRGSAVTVHKERQATSVPVIIHASRVSPSKAELEAAMQKLSIDTAMALRMKDVEVRFPMASS